MPQQVVLETSFQISKNFFQWCEDLLQENQEIEFLSTFFILYEFRISLIKSAIDFFNLVRITDNPSIALAEWSNRFSPRSLKNVLLVHSSLLQLNDSIKADVPNYLDSLESCIIYLDKNFDTNIRRIVGNFSKDPIVHFQINSREDFAKFNELYNSRPCIPLVDFWKQNTQSLDLFLEKGPLYPKNPGFQKIYKKLQVLKSKPESGDNPSVNKAIGDAVISVDQPKSTTIWTLDASFIALSEILEKEYTLHKKPKSATKVNTN